MSSQFTLLLVWCPSIVGFCQVDRMSCILCVLCVFDVCALWLKITTGGFWLIIGVSHSRMGGLAGY